MAAPLITYLYPGMRQASQLELMELIEIKLDCGIKAKDIIKWHRLRQ